MPPLPYPHRAVFLPTLFGPSGDDALREMAARVIAAMVFDHFVSHPVLSLADFDEEKFVDDQGVLLDVSHPQMHDGIDWYFRVARRKQVLWLAFDLSGQGPIALACRDASGYDDEWHTPPMPLSTAFDALFRQWFGVARLFSPPSLPHFTLQDVIETARALAAARSTPLANPAMVPPGLLSLHGPLAIAGLRVWTTLVPDARPAVDHLILTRAPHHVVARRAEAVAAIAAGGDRRVLLELIANAPNYAKARVTIWGDAFGTDSFDQRAGLYHQGVAALLAPANPYACHNYSVLLAEQGRREESYRWADRATVAAPQFAVAQLDCVRRLRQLGRPAQAIAEAQYRCREIIEQTRGAHTEFTYHAYLLLAFVHFDVGRLGEAIDYADQAFAGILTDPQLRATFEWARRRVMHWKTDAGLLARAVAWDAHYRGDPGRACAGMMRTRVSDADDAAMLLSSLMAIGREEQAHLAFHHFAGCDGGSLLGDGKARLYGARALLLAGELHEALEQIQIVQLRRPASRFEAEVNRLLRLAACRSSAEWERVILRRYDAGAIDLARRAARDLADFVPKMDGPVVERALGPRTPFSLAPQWLEEFIVSLPGEPHELAAVAARLALPAEHSLRAADALAQEWWNVLVPPAKDRDAHAIGALAALGLALAHYFALCSGAPTPIGGAYRHIATEALQLVRRARYQLDQSALRALLTLLERLSATPDWLFDTWLLRIEQTFDIEAEHGGYLDSLLVGLPRMRAMLRGDERIGWELRTAQDLAADDSQYAAAATLFERCARAVEGGAAYLVWSKAALRAAPPAQHLDVHWSAATANPVNEHAPWLAVALALFDLGRGADAMEPASHAVVAMANAAPATAARALARLEASWDAANMDFPFDGEEAATYGRELLDADELERSIPLLRWATARAPKQAGHAQNLALALCRAGRGPAALRALGPERQDAPFQVGRALLDAGRSSEGFAMLRFASRRFKTADQWTLLANCAAMLGHDTVCADACRQLLATGYQADETLLAMYAVSLYRSGEYAASELEARRLHAIATGPNGTPFGRFVATLCFARSLAGQRRFPEAKPYAESARALGADGTLAADLMETIDAIKHNSVPPVRSAPEPARLAFAKLERGEFTELGNAISAPDWGVLRAGLTALEFRGVDTTNGLAPRALDAAIAVLGRTEGVTNLDAALVRIAALRIRENAFIQVDPVPPLGPAMEPAVFEQLYQERLRDPRHRKA